MGRIKCRKEIFRVSPFAEDGVSDDHKGLMLHLLTITPVQEVPIFGGRNREKEVDLSRLVFWKSAVNGVQVEGIG